MRVYFFSFGKLKTSGLRQTGDYYLQLLRPWVHAEEVELKPLAVPDKSQATRKDIQIKEGLHLLEKIEKKISSRGIIILLDETGKTLPTQGWAKTFLDLESQSIPEIAFCIGSSLGFSEDVKKKSKLSLSFGPQTLPHELARVVLFEQVYRAWSVIKGHPYHNEGS